MRFCLVLMAMALLLPGETARAQSSRSRSGRYPTSSPGRASNFSMPEKPASDGSSSSGTIRIRGRTIVAVVTGLMALVGFIFRAFCSLVGLTPNRTRASSAATRKGPRPDFSAFGAPPPVEGPAQPPRPVPVAAAPPQVASRPAVQSRSPAPPPPIPPRRPVAARRPAVAPGENIAKLKRRLRPGNPDRGIS